MVRIARKRPLDIEPIPALTATPGGGNDTCSDVDSHYSHGSVSKRSRVPESPHVARRKPTNAQSRRSPSLQAQANDANRPSKFKEGSMRDRASDKPPSMFMRVPDGNQALTAGGSRLLNTDTLMEEYHESSSRKTSNDQSSRGASSSSAAAIVQNQDSHAKSSTMFRFGKSLATSFNPVAIWQRIAKNYEECKRELDAEGRAEVQQRRLQERKAMELKAQAEARYARLKQSGQLGMQGTQYGSVVSPPIFSAGYHANTNVAHSRDEGEEANFYQMASTRSDLLLGGRQSADVQREDLKPASRMSSFFRSPSLANLKKSHSEAHLPDTIGQRRSSRTVIPSEQSQATLGDSVARDAERNLRKVHSKKDLAKQRKITKRISDLELKLQQAHRELQDSLAGTASPESVMPPPSLAASVVGDSQRPKGRHFGRGAMLETLPSERLLAQDKQDMRITPPFSALDGAATHSGAGQPFATFSNPPGTLSVGQRAGRALSHDDEPLSCTESEVYQSIEVDVRQAPALKRTTNKSAQEPETSLSPRKLAKPKGEGLGSKSISKSGNRQDTEVDIWTQSAQKKTDTAASSRSRRTAARKPLAKRKSDELNARADQSDDKNIMAGAEGDAVDDAKKTPPRQSRKRLKRPAKPSTKAAANTDTSNIPGGKENSQSPEKMDSTVNVQAPDTSATGATFNTKQTGKTGLGRKKSSIPKLSASDSTKKKPTRAATPVNTNKPLPKSPPPPKSTETGEPISVMPDGKDVPLVPAVPSELTGDVTTGVAATLYLRRADNPVLGSVRLSPFLLDGAETDAANTALDPLAAAGEKAAVESIAGVAIAAGERVRLSRESRPLSRSPIRRKAMTNLNEQFEWPDDCF